MVLGDLYSDAHIFLNVEEDYPNVIRWAKEILERPAVQRGIVVNKTWGDDGLAERHSPSDFKTFSSATKKQKTEE